MKKILTILAAAATVSSVSQASLINFQSGSVATYLQADAATNLDASYTFALGTFTESALSGVISTWSAGFNDEMTAENGWLTSGPPPVLNTFQGNVAMDDNSSATASAYIFGTNGSDELIIFRNAAWVFPTFDNLDTTADIFSLADANTQIVTAGGGWTSYASNITMLSTTAVPEPSTFAALAGLCALSFVMVRRRRA
jgi:hypothetical protein